MKQKRTLLILCGVLIAFAAAYYGASYYTAQKEAEAYADEVIQSLLDTIYVTELEEEITGVTWSYYGEELSFELDGEDWRYTEDTTLNIDSYYIEAVISTYSSLTAERELVDGDEISSYGLDEPTHYVILTDTTGVETTYYIGNEADTSYYLTINDKTDIYVVSSDTVSAIYYVLSQVIVQDTFSAPSSDELDTVVIASADDEITYTVDDTDAMAMIASGLSVLTLSDCMDVNSTDQEADYGLDEETRIEWTMTYNIETEVEVESTEEATEESTEDSTEEATVETTTVIETYEETIYIGSYIATFDTYYVQVAGSNIVYSVASDTIEMMLNEYVEEVVE